MNIIPDNTLITGDVAKFREVSGPDVKPGTIEVHIIRPGRGSSGYYSEKVLKQACEAGVYPAGMLMHWDHPTRQQEEDQPARVTGTIAAALVENAQYREAGDKNAWDGPGPYALAEVRPKFTEDLKWLSGKIGVSHYVDGKSTEGKAEDGQKGRIITELVASPFNSVDFVTIPGAGGHSKFNEVLMKLSEGWFSFGDVYPGKSLGDATDSEISHYKSLFAYVSGTGSKESDYHLPYKDPKTGQVDLPHVRNAIAAIGGAHTGKPMDVPTSVKDMLQKILDNQNKKESRRKMTDKQISIRLSEIMASDPEVITEIRERLAEELKLESVNESQKKKLTEAETRIKTLETENKELKEKVAEKAAREYITAEVGKAKLTETASKSLTDALIKQIVLSEDGAIDTVKFGTIVSEAIKAKQYEIAAILKESGATEIHDNGGSSGSGDATSIKKAREDLRDTYLGMGKTKEQADKMAGIEANA